MRGILLTTEEEGVALVAGAWAGGQRCALLMQSSGVGNCINMFSLVQLFRLPFFTIVTMRGEWGEFNHWQVPMGSTTQAVFELSGIKVLRANNAQEVREVVEAGAAPAYNACTPTAVLTPQRLIGARTDSEEHELARAVGTLDCRKVRPSNRPDFRHSSMNSARRFFWMW